MSNETTQGRMIEILLVEDNPGDARLCQEAVKESKLRNNLYIVEDGEKAMEFLKREGEFTQKPKPDLILLDLNLPKKDGRQVLKEIKESDGLKRIPVVILTSSKAEEDIAKTYDLHANCYVNKPLDFNRFSQVVKSIEDFWFEIVRLPADWKLQPES